MSETELNRDPLDVAADEAAEIMAMRGKASWANLVGVLQAQAETAQRRFLLAQRLQAAFAAEGGQLPLIPDVVAAPEPTKPRAKRRQLMHEGQDATFVCQKCSKTLAIPNDTTDSARKRGVPCPKCNVTEAEAAE